MKCRLWSAFLLLGLASPALSQQWHRGDSLDLVRRAAARRDARNADSGLGAWQAEAHGFLRFASVLDQGGGPVERVIRADELRVEVYGEAPNRSKQIIRAWRDTTFLPNEIAYHRDHLGIVANDFGATIRLGQGEEVRDVPHPLSGAGMSRYLFSIGDTVVISTTTGRTRVAAVAVRPLDPADAGTVGTLFLDLDRAELVRFVFTFTPAAYRDPSVQSIAVSLENGLQQRAHWLPWKQSIVISRGVPFFNIPFRTIIRADWTIDDYQLGVVHPADRFVGAYIDGPAVAQPGGSWPDAIAAHLDGLPATTADLDHLMQEASRELGGRRLDGAPRLQLQAGGLSDLVSINRIEGVTVGLGARLALGSDASLSAHTGYGISDHRVVGHVAVAVPVGATRITVAAERAMQDVGDRPVISGVARSLDLLQFGEDLGDYVLLDRASATVSWQASKLRFSISGGREWSWSVATAFDPPGDVTAPDNPSLGRGGIDFVRADVRATGASGNGWQLRTEVTPDWTRTFGTVRLGTALGPGRTQVDIDAGLSTGDLAPYRAFVIGGRGTLPGVPFRSMAGSRMAMIDMQWLAAVPLPTPPLPLPMAKRVRLPSAIGPFLAIGTVGGELAAAAPWTIANGRVEGVAGVRADLWGPLLRLEAASSLRTGNWTFTVDVHPDWWPLM